MNPARLLALLGLCLLAACGETPKGEGPATLALTRTDFSRMEGWASGSHDDGLQAFLRSCDKLQRVSPDKTVGQGVLAAPARVWHDVCRAGQMSVNPRSFFEANFTPFIAQADKGGERSDALYTGYYEPELRGSLVYHPPYTTPLYPPPADIKSRKGRSDFDRRAIDMGALGNLAPLVWVDDPVDAFFLEIQGSGVVNLSEGGQMRLGFAEQNGHGYVAIGKVLLERGLMAPGTVSAPTIKDWLRSNPTMMREIMWENPSYVFFKVREGDAAVGAQGVGLIPEAAAAVDRKIVPLGTPLFVNVALPTIMQGTVPWSKLLIAQDTGGAIKGPARADIFFGRGQEAEYRAGNMHARGRMTLLVPSAIAARL